ncbi:MAG: YafY family transcriptional regulator [bacterium]|nr:YafY family transcriptional regulator [bacterium]
MRRADRLFRLVQILRRCRLAIARDLARELEVSERTVYRDVADLVASGVPIRGEAGVGYSIDSGYDLPPLMFNVEEIEALVLGARMVQSWCGEELASAAADVVTKVEQVLPLRLRERLDRTALYVPDFGWTLPGAEQLADLRGALRDRRRVEISYQDRKDEQTIRILRPLGIFFWGATATLGAWCELRDDFRNFRIDRIESLNVLPEVFSSEAGKSLHDYYQAMAERYADEP